MQIKNFSNYEIFPNEGKIFSYKSNRWIGAKNTKGYWKCALYGDDGKVWNTQLHRVVWVAVNGDIPNGYEVNHIDEDKGNNSISNLNLLTHKENINFGTRNERHSKAMKGHIVSMETKERMAKALKGNTNGKANKNNPKRSKQVGMFKDGVLIMTFPSTAEAQRNGYNQGHISACCRGCFNRQGNNTYKGYQWQYI